MEYNVAVEAIPTPYTTTLGTGCQQLGFGGTFPRNRIFTLPPVQSAATAADAHLCAYDSDSSLDDTVSRCSHVKRKSSQALHQSHAPPKSPKRRLNFIAPKKRQPLSKTFLTSSNVSLTSRQTETSSGYYSPTPLKRFDTRAVLNELWNADVNQDQYQTFGMSEPEMNEYLDCLESQFQQEVWGRCLTKQKSYSANDVSVAPRSANRRQSCYGPSVALYDDNGQPARAAPANLAYALEMYYNLYTMG